jgi:hypothetical protein
MCTTTVTPPPVLRQNWKTLARLASWWSKPPDVDVCPHTIFICPSVLRHKLINLLPLGFKDQTKNYHGDFETQITKPSTMVLRSNQETVAVVLRLNHWQTIATSFEAKSEKPRFSSPPRVWCGWHTVSPDLLIVQPLSTRLMTDHPQSSVPSLILLPRFSSLPTISHSPPTHYETSKHVSPHRITQYGLVQP